MRGINYITDPKNRKIAVQIDIKTIEKNRDKLEDLLDIIVAESRKNESSKSWEEVKKSLKEQGKL